MRDRISASAEARDAADGERYGTWCGESDPGPCGGSGRGGPCWLAAVVGRAKISQVHAGKKKEGGGGGNCTRAAHHVLALDFTVSPILFAWLVQQQVRDRTGAVHFSSSSSSPRPPEPNILVQLQYFITTLLC